MGMVIEAVNAPHVNGVALAAPGEAVAPAELRLRASTELLRQAAQRRGLLAADDPAEPGILSAAAEAAIEALLERELALPEPAEADCRRHYEATRARFRRGDRVLARHILFAVTPGVDVGALRSHAEAQLIDLRASDGAAFERAAARWSNCPTGATGGALGWLGREDCAEEFAAAVFEGREVGVLPRLVATRHGFHVVEVLQRVEGETPAYAEVAGAVTQALRAAAFASAARQFVQVLAGEARVVGVDLEAADSPLTQ